MAFVEIIPLASCHKGGGTFVRHGDLELAVFRLTNPKPCANGLQPVEAGPGAVPDGTVVVIDNACPHAGGNLSGGELAGKTVTCKWHHWTFDLETGACMDSPRARARVRCYRTEIRDGVVWADLAAPVAPGM